MKVFFREERSTSQSREISGSASQCFHGFNHPGEHVLLLPTTGFHDRQQPLDKPAPSADCVPNDTFSRYQLPNATLLCALFLFGSTLSLPKVLRFLRCSHKPLQSSHVCVVSDATTGSSIFADRLHLFEKSRPTQRAIPNSSATGRTTPRLDLSSRVPGDEPCGNRSLISP